YVSTGEAILAGSANIDGSLTLQVSCSSSDYQYHQIDNLLEQAQRVKPRLSQLADHIAGYFVALVLVCSALSAAYWFLTADGDTAFIIALSVLVVSCPCALSLATPLTLTATVNALRREGIVVKNAEAFNTAKQLCYAIFDKTGTLTKGQPHIVGIEIFSSDSEALLSNIAASLEQTSSHPIAKAFTSAQALKPINELRISAGAGIEGLIDGQRYKLGSAQFCGIASSSLEKSVNIVVHLCRNDKEIARFKLDDEIREDAREIIQMLRSRNIEMQVLSGDNSQHVNKVANELGISQVFSNCSSAQKLAHIRRLQNAGACVMMVGDGVNDAPVIAAADISFSMSDASDITRSHADVILLNNRLSGISQFFNMAQKSRKILLQNIGWAIAYNATALPLAAIGLIPPYIAAIGMSASSLLVLLNAMRLARPAQEKKSIFTAASAQAAAELSANG
ncbi:MAG: heavy metal translocating P-type ATPase, partial [Spongiibacteraceae bacterium]